MEEKLAETKSVWFRKVGPHKLRDCLIESFLREMRSVGNKVVGVRG